MRILVLVVLAMSGTTVAQEPAFSSSDAADAAERVSGRRAHMGADVRRIAGTRMAGPAITMRLVRDDSASATAEGLKAIQVVEQAPAGSVVVVCGGDADHAVFGATFATLAKSRGLGGFVIDGAMRGVADLRRIGVPVFARGVAPGSAGGHYRLAAVNETVTCAGAQVSPGDLVVADDDGVAVVAAAIRDQVTRRAAALRQEKEALLPLIAKHRSYTKAVEEYRRQRGMTQPGSHD
jgi:4-hydroxy-4-methyl-2-oxoglutarate aldolase